MLLAAAALAVVSITPAAATTVAPVSPISMESTRMRYNYADIDGIKIFYREAGDPSKPTILLLHGFPSSSHMYRDLIPLLAKKFHVVAPDYPGSGYSDAPPASKFEPTFANLAKVMNDFTTAVDLKDFVIYMQDFGGPVGFRMAVQHPERVKGLIIQNANAYEEGIMPQELAAMKERAAGSLTAEQEEHLDMILSPGGTEFFYKTGVRDFAAVSPDAYHLDNFVLAKPEYNRIQRALLVGYYDNVLQYPKWQAYMQKYQPRTLILYRGWTSNCSVAEGLGEGRGPDLCTGQLVHRRGRPHESAEGEPGEGGRPTRTVVERRSARVAERVGYARSWRSRSEERGKPKPASRPSLAIRVNITARAASVGFRSVRQALYIPALVSIRFNADLRINGALAPPEATQSDHR